MKPALVALVLVCMAPLALAATVPTCAPGCVLATLSGFVPPHWSVVSGGAVTWDGVDLAHSATSDPPGPACFDVAIPGGRTGSAIFSIQADGLHAQLGTRDYACPNTTPLPDGSLLLSYHCKYHANMEATLQVVPS